MENANAPVEVEEQKIPVDAAPVVEQGNTEAVAPTEEQSKAVKGKAKGKAAPKAAKKENSKETKAAAPKTKRVVKTIPIKQREELLKNTKVDEAKVIAALKAGKTVWEVAEEIFGCEFDHADRTCWIFYQKVNAIRKKAGINNEPLKVSPQTKTAIGNYLKDHTDKELFELISRAK